MTVLTQVKIFGERNTSTNALQDVIQSNSHAQLLPSVVSELPIQNNWPYKLAHKLNLDGKPLREWLIDMAYSKVPPIYYWKHCATYFSDISSLKDTLVVFCVRNPASWLLALHKRPYHAKSKIPSNFSEFLRMKWSTVRRDRLEKTYLTPIQLYNEKIKSYRCLIKKLDEINIAWEVVKFENFAVSQEASTRALFNHIQVKSSFTPIKRSTKDKNKNLEFYKLYYGEQLWKEEITDKETRLITDNIEWSNATFFGYEEDYI